RALPVPPRGSDQLGGRAQGTPAAPRQREGRHRLRKGPAGHGRRGPDPAGPAQPRPERAPGDGQAQGRAGHHRAPVRAGRPEHPPGSARLGTRHPSQRAAANLRRVHDDEGSRRGYGPGSLGVLLHHRTASGIAAGRQPSGRRRGLHRRAASGHRLRLGPVRIAAGAKFAVLSFLCVLVFALTMGFALSSLLTRAVQDWEWQNTAALARREVSGAAALGRLLERSYDLVFSDMKMPGMSGVELYDEIARRYPGIERRIVFVTGDTLNPGTKLVLDRTGAVSLAKPFDVDAIRGLVPQHASRPRERDAEVTLRG